MSQATEMAAEPTPSGGSPGLRTQGPRVLAIGSALIAAMAVGSVLMWIGAPFGLIWLASHLQKKSSPALGPYLVVVIGVPIAMVVIGKVLAQHDHVDPHVTGLASQQRRVPLPWHKSMRAERESTRRHTVLDVVMVVSVAVAGLLFVVWFFLLAHPGAPQA